MPRLSIVIPCTASDARFEDTLVSVLQSQPDDCEILVVFAGRYDDPYDLSGEVRFVEAPERSELLELINLGLECACAEIVHVLLCGAEVAEGWTAEPLNRFEDPAVAAVGPLLSSQESPDEFVIGGVDYRPGGWRWLCAAKGGRRLPRILGPTLCAGFYRRGAVQQVGGWDPSVGTELADIDLALSLAAAGYRAVCEPASHVRQGDCWPTGTDGFRAGRHAEHLFWKHAPGQRWWGLILHGLLIAGEIVRCPVQPQTIARLFGRLTILFGRPRRLRRPAVRLSIEPETRQPESSARRPSRPSQRQRRVA